MNKFERLALKKLYGKTGERKVRELAYTIYKAKQITSFEKIIEIIKLGENVTEEELISKKRDRYIVQARQLIYKLAIDFCWHSYSQLSGRFYQDHATVVHAKKTIEEYFDIKLLNKYKYYKQKILKDEHRRYSQEKSQKQGLHNETDSGGVEHQTTNSQ